MLSSPLRVLTLFSSIKVTEVFLFLSDFYDSGFDCRIGSDSSISLILLKAYIYALRIDMNSAMRKSV